MKRKIYYADGYARVWDSKAKRKRFLHRVVWENKHGPIPEGFFIHHLDQDKLNNRIENLQMLCHLDHNRIHSGCKLISGDWYKPCRKCGKMKHISFYYERPDGVSSWCKPCHRKDARDRARVKARLKKRKS